MRNHTQEPTNKPKLKSIFFLVDSNRKTIATDLSIEQAKPISSRISGCLIKFQDLLDYLVQFNTHENLLYLVIKKAECKKNTSLMVFIHRELSINKREWSQR